MGNIKMLSNELINKIAAGEVVERPSSILKELIENSLDAQATSIIVEAENGGVKSIRVTDDGKGMSRQDASLSVKRYATSKISDFQDFFRLMSYGFRGEALASIAAVSKFTLQTRQRESLEGTEVLVNQQLENAVSVPGEAPSEVRPAGCKDGTSVLVKDLFFNVPARRKFLKSINTEYQWLLDVFMQFAVLHYNVSFKFIYNEKTVFDLPKVLDWKERVAAVLGEDTGKDLMTVSNDQYEVKVEGFVGKPSIARKNKKAQYLFVNDRPISDYMVSKAVKDAFGTFLVRENHPAFVLKLTLRPDWVDVNVHPRKTEVRFMYPQVIFRCVYKVVKDILEKEDFTVAPKLAEESYSVYNKNNSSVSGESNLNLQTHRNDFKVSSQNFPKQSINTSSFNTVKKSLDFTKEILNKPSGGFSNNNLEIFEKEIEHSSGIEDKIDWRLLGVAHKSYIVAENQNGIMIIDQHAAAERVLYEKLKLQKGKVASQKLLLPVLFEFSPKEVALVEEYKHSLLDSGFELESFGNATFQLLAIPQELSKVNIKDLVKGIISDLETTGVQKLDSVEERIDLIFKYASCRGAIKFNDSLSEEEAIALLRDMKEYNVWFCPHGRPAFIEFSLGELGKKFNR